MKRSVHLQALLLCLATAPALAAKPVTELYDAVIAPPQTAEDAARWFDRDKLVQPDVLAQKQALEAERDTAITHSAQAGADAGGLQFDLARMQSDPAYAAQMKQQMQDQAQQLQAMPRDQQIVAAMQMAQQQQAAMSADASRTLSEPPAVAQAVQGIRSAQTLQLQNLGAAQLLQRGEQSIASRYDPQYQQLNAQFQGGGEGCNSACVARIEANNREVKTRIAALASREMGEWRTLFDQVKAAHGQEMTQGQRYLSATSYGAAATSNLDRDLIENYHATLVGRSLELLGISVEAARRGAAHAHP